ncbi:UEV domain-containing protein, partial [Flammula alnicola]
MSSLSLTQKWLRDTTQPYSHASRVYADVDTALARFPTFRPKSDVYTFDDGRTQLLLCVHGLLPITFRQASYNIPMAFWITREYPRQPPIAYVVPTNDMLVKSGKYVDVSGRCNIEYIQHWERKDEGCSLSALLAALQDHFSSEPPVYSKPKDISPAPRQQSPALNQPYAARPPPPLPSTAALSASNTPPPLPPSASARPALPSKPPSMSPASAANYQVAPPVNTVWPLGPMYPPSFPPTGNAREVPSTPQVFRGDSLAVHHHTHSQSPPLPPRLSPALSLSPPPPPPLPPQAQYQFSPPPLPHAPNFVRAPTFVPEQPRPEPPRPPIPDLLDQDDSSSSAMTMALGGVGALAPPPRPPNPELMRLQTELHQKLTAEISSLSQALALDAERLRAQQADLLAGEPAIKDEMARLEAVRDVCRTVADRTRKVVVQAESNIAELRKKGDPEVDELVCATSIVHNQLINLIADDNAIEDTIYHLHRALNAGRIDLERFLRSTRVLAEEQFMKRALIEKIQASV